MAAVDNGAWDGPAAMSRCANSDNPAAAYRAICAGRRDGDPELQSSWALPHHANPGAPPNAAGVRNSLSRLPQTQGLINAAAARRHLDAHMAEIQGARDAVRAIFPGHDADGHPVADVTITQLRSAEDDAMPTLFGHFAVFDQWTEIDSVSEGRFLERIRPGAFNRSFTEDRGRMRVLFQHGKDPQVADKPLGPIAELREDERGAYYEVPLLDTSYNRDLLPGLAAGLYGASFRFKVTAEDMNRKPKAGPHNPRSLPERSIVRADVMEFGPVTFPAYSGASAAVRSLTDDFYGVHNLEEIIAEPGQEEEAHHWRHQFRTRSEWLTYLTSKR